jgi:hypothetical protein
MIAKHLNMNDYPAGPHRVGMNATEQVIARLEADPDPRIAALEALLREAEADIYWANVVLKERIRAALEK